MSCFFPPRNESSLPQIYILLIVRVPHYMKFQRVVDLEMYLALGSKTCLGSTQ